MLSDPFTCYTLCLGLSPFLVILFIKMYLQVEGFKVHQVATVTAGEFLKVKSSPRLFCLVCFRFSVWHAEKPVWLPVYIPTVRTANVPTPIPWGFDVCWYGTVFPEWPCRSLWTSSTPLWTPRLVKVSSTVHRSYNQLIINKGVQN